MGWVENAETLTISDVTSQSRIDRIVARWSLEERNISLAILKGIESGNSVAPDLTRDGDIYEIALADIAIDQNTIEIIDANITDLRLNTELCGIVTGAIDQVDTTTLFNQYQSWLETTTKNAEENLNITLETFTNDFNTWFENLQYVLSDDVAGKLEVEIEENKNAIEENKNAIENISISIENIIPKNAHAHNAIYRGNDITDLWFNERDQLKDEINNETFDDIFIGDYIWGKTYHYIDDVFPTLLNSYVNVDDYFMYYLPSEPTTDEPTTNTDDYFWAASNCYDNLFKLSLYNSNDPDDHRASIQFKYYVAAINYMQYNSGQDMTKYPHILLIPSFYIGYEQMKDTATTDGNYYKTSIYRLLNNNSSTIINIIQNDLDVSLSSMDNWGPASMEKGYPVPGAVRYIQYASLMSETMVYGTHMMAPMTHNQGEDDTTIVNNMYDMPQLPLYRYYPELVRLPALVTFDIYENTGTATDPVPGSLCATDSIGDFWISNTVSTSKFGTAGKYPYCLNANNEAGVLPYFIVGKNNLN